MTRLGVMSTAEWALLLTFEAVLIAFLPYVRKLWRDETKIFDGRLVRAVRAVPFLLATGVLVIPLTLGGYLTDDDGRVTVGGTAFGFAVLILLAADVVGTFTLWRWGRPEFLVPPHMRATSGKQAYRSRSSARRRERRESDESSRGGIEHG